MAIYDFWIFKVPFLAHFHYTEIILLYLLTMKQPNIHKMMIQLQHLIHNVKIPIKAQLGQLSTMNFSKIF